MKSVFRRALSFASCTAVAFSCVPLQAFAFSENSNDSLEMSKSDISLEEFAKGTLELSQNFENENGFFGQIEIKAQDLSVYIDGEKAEIKLSEKPEMVGDTLMADSSVFEYLDESALVENNDGEIRISTENGDIELKTGSDSATAFEENITLSESVLQSDESVVVPIADVASSLGYQAVTTQDSVILSNPFESARLIVKSNGDGDIDKLNSIDAVCGYMGLTVLQFETSQDAFEAYRFYSQSDNVEFVTPSQQRSIQTTQEAEIVHNTWGAQAMETDSFNSELVSLGKSDEEVIVAVLDTGIDLDHEAFEGRIVDSGANFSSSQVSCAEDDQGHGTHVSGIICDLTLENVKIMPVKVLDSSGKGYDELIFTGIIYAIESGADVINMSLGGFGTGVIYDEAIRIAKENGVVICAAAGNDNVDTFRSMPANCDGIITVSALDEDMSFAEYSNYGSEVEFAAPGTNVLAAYIGGQYAYLSGTSMAAPHVSAAAAMLKTYDLTLDSSQIENILASNALDLGDIGRDDYFGYGAVYMNGIEILNEKCQNLELSMESGEYDDAISVEITSSDKNVQIYYTLDSSAPSKENGILYQGAIELASTAKLRAKAFCDGKYESEEASAVYIIAQSDIENCYEISDGVLTKYNGVLSNVVIPENVNGQTVTSIGINAFSDNSKIKSVILPESVSKIQANAFSGCTTLESVSANGVLTIEQNAFSNCESLKSIDMESVQTLGVSCFENCTALESVYMPSAKTIESKAFLACDNLESVKMPQVTFVGESAFYDCVELCSAELDFENMTELGGKAFYMCVSLKSAIICLNLESIGAFCFYGCSKIESVALSANITQIPEGCFENCSNMYYLAAENVTAISSRALYGCGDVYTDIDIENAELLSEDAIFESTLKAIDAFVPSEFQAIETDSLIVSQNCIGASYYCSESGTYYIEILGAISPEILITFENGEEIQAAIVSQSALKTVYSVAFESANTYKITASSKSSEYFSLNVSNAADYEKIDISGCEIECAELFSDTPEEDIKISVKYSGSELVINEDYIIKYSSDSVSVFGINDYCGICRVYPKITESIELGVVYDLNSLYGESEFAFIPNETKTYYYYALYNEDEFEEFAENGPAVSVWGKILNSEKELIYSSDSCVVGDCYSYTYFYIEAYLEAGKTYYLQSSTSAKAKGEYSIKITDTFNSLFDAEIYVDTPVIATGEEVFTNITVYWQGEELVCGEDYLVCTKNNVKPGYADVYVLGLKDYFGMSKRQFTITAQNYTPTELSVGKTAEFEVAGDGFAGVSTQIETAAKYRITFESDSEISSYIKHTPTNLSYQRDEKVIEMNLSAGEYVIMFYTADSSDANVSITIERLYAISDASVYVSDLEYEPGVTQIPSVTVMYGTTRLTENKDYELEFIANSPLPGVHYYKITGIGNYTGSAKGSYNVECSINAFTATSISDGEHTVNITKAGNYKVFKFTASETATYLLSTNELSNVALIVFDQYGNTVASNSAPMGFGATFDMTSGDVMYIAAMYYDADKTGTWTFEMTSDFVLLEDATAVYEEYVDFYGGKTIPEISLTYGDYTLVEGVDYEYYYASNCTNYGTATVCFRGLGKYKFNKYVEYTLKMPMTDIVAKAQNITLDNPKYYDSDYGECGVYKFQAPYDGYFLFSQLTVVDSAFVQFYDENGNFQKKRVIGGGTDANTRFFLKENESLYMVTGYDLCQNYELYSGYSVKVSCQNSRITKTIYSENGITYTAFTSLGYAVVSGADADITDVEILSEVEGLAVTEINAFVFAECQSLERVIIPDSVVEIGASCFENSSVKKVFVPETMQTIGYRAFAQTNITKLCIFSPDAQFYLDSVQSPSVVYGYADTTAQSYCAENDVEFVLISLTMGDVNADGRINASDATIVARAATGIVVLDPDMLLCADVNGDGRINATDSTMIARYSVGILAKFPVSI